MGIMEKLYKMKQMPVNEDWRDTAKEYLATKKVEDKHLNRLESLDYNLTTKYGDWYIKLKFRDDKIKVTVENEKEYVGSEWFKNGESAKKYIFDGAMADKIYKHIREKLAGILSRNELSKEDMKKALSDANKKVDALQNAIDLQIDTEELDKKLKRYNTYSEAIRNRTNLASQLKFRASQEFEREHKLEVGDKVYGKASSSLRQGKEYVVKSIEQNGLVNGKKETVYVLAPANGQGYTHKATRSQIYLDRDQVDAAIKNPDDPKWNKFDEQKYMMDRYSADRQFDEAVELLNDCGMIVESVVSAEDEETILAKYSKYNKLDDLEVLLRRDTKSEPEVTFGRRNKIVWIQTAPFTLVGTYRFDDESGEYDVKLNSVKF